MIRSAPEKRKYSRVPTVPSSLMEGMPHDDPVILNVSHGDACLWLNDPPPAQVLALQFRCDGHEHVLRARLVWSRPCMSSSDHKDPRVAGGWLVGFVFIDNDGRGMAGEIPLDLACARRTEVSIIPGPRADESWQRPWPESVEARAGILALNPQSLSGIKTAASDLVPVFAKHFSGVRMVVTRDRPKISASFRPVEERDAVERGRRGRPAQPPPSARLERSAHSPQPHTLPDPGRRRSLMVLSGVAAVILAGTVVMLSRKRDDKIATAKAPVPARNVPAWAKGLDPAALDGWIQIHAAFKLPDGAIRAAIRTLRANDKYAPGQRLHDLTVYPVQVKRAFSLLASAQTGAPFDLGPLKNDLQARVVQGVRFPDEPEGGRYSSLQRELFDNVVVLAVVELLHRRQADSRVKRLVATIRQARA